MMNFAYNAHVDVLFKETTAMSDRPQTLTTKLAKIDCILDETGLLGIYVLTQEVREAHGERCLITSRSEFHESDGSVSSDASAIRNAIAVHDTRLRLPQPLRPSFPNDQKLCARLERAASGVG